MNKCFSFSDSIVSQDWENDLDILRNDCKKAFTSRAVLSGDKYSQGVTFFLSSDSKPRCTLEKFAHEIFHYHTRDISYNPSNSGVEWWVLYVHHCDDVGFHWDRDYGLEIEEDKMVHPYLGTVTYLSNIGGPTVMLDMAGDLSEEEYENYQFAKCQISYPKIGKHVTFDGSLLHGAPSSLYSETLTSSSSDDDNDDDDDSSEEESIPENEARVTFLVNIWLDHIPTQAEPLPEQLLSSLSNSSSLHMKFEPEDVTILNHESFRSDFCKSSWALSANEQNYQIAIPLPNESSLKHELTDSSLGRTWHLIFPRGEGLLLLDAAQSGSEDASENEEENEDDEQEEQEEEEEVKVGRKKREFIESDQAISQKKKK